MVAAMSDAKSPQDLPMNEILAAIRRKIIEDETGAAAAPDANPAARATAAPSGRGAAAGEAGETDEVLELTAALNEDGSTRQLAPIGGSSRQAAESAAPTPATSRDEAAPADIASRDEPAPPA